MNIFIFEENKISYCFHSGCFVSVHMVVLLLTVVTKWQAGYYTVIIFSTGKSPKTKKWDHMQKLEGSVRFEDILEGWGPRAKRGQRVSKLGMACCRYLFIGLLCILLGVCSRFIGWCTFLCTIYLWTVDLFLQVDVYYEGRVLHSQKLFDRCCKGKPLTFHLGQGEVIKGWEVGVVGMKVGGKRRLIVPSHMA